MNDTLLFFFPSDSPCFHDLRRENDDKRVIRNPHKGWYFHYVDNGFAFPRYRDTLKEGDDLSWLPGLDHLYLRFDWSDIEKTEGVYDWSAVDSIVEEWGKKGYTFTFRLCTFESNRPMIRYATPEWVFRAGAKYHEIKGKAPAALLGAEEDVEFTAYEPVYDDEIYLSKLEKMMEEYGRHFDGHPLVEFVDVGTFGTWGEGHTSSGSNSVYSPECVKKHIDLHLKNFRRTFVVETSGGLTHAAKTSEDTARKLSSYCAAHGMGVRCDSMYVKYHSDTFGYDMMAIPTVFENYWRHAPVDLEASHLTMNIANGTLDAGFRMIETMRNAHATFAGFHGDPYLWYGAHKDVHDYCANRLGYWYFLDGYELPDVPCGADTAITLYITNKGFAPAYHRYEMRLFAKDKEGKITLLNSDSPDNRLWMPGKTEKVFLHLGTSELAAGEYDLYVGLYENGAPVRFAVRKDREEESGGALLGSLLIEE